MRRWLRPAIRAVRAHLGKGALGAAEVQRGPARTAGPAAGLSAGGSSVAADRNRRE